MKRVLFGGSVETYMEEEYCREFIRILLKKYFYVETCVNASVRDLGVYESSIDDRERYDLIVAFNEIGYSWVEFVHHPGIPGIYILPGRSYTDSAANYEDFQQTIFVNSDRPIKSEQTTLHRINLPFFVEKNPVFNPKTRKKIMVCVDNKPLLLRLLLILNTLKNYDITVIADEERLQVITNPKITIRSTEKDLNALIAQSGLLITDKYIATKGIYSYKPVIVVGESGYGGLVTPDNCVEQFNNGFCGNADNGRDYLLLQWVYVDIERALTYSKTELQAIIDLVKPEAKKQEEEFNSIFAPYM